MRSRRTFCTRLAAAVAATGWPMSGLAATADTPAAPAVPASSDTALTPHALASLLLLGVAQAGSRWVAVGERGHVLVTDPAARRWMRAASGTTATLTALHFADALNGWAVGHDATILQSRDGGRSWRLQHRDVKAQGPLLDVWFADASRGFAVGAYGSCFSTRDGGEQWTPATVARDDRHLNAIVGAADGRVHVVGESGLVCVGDVGDADRGPWRALTAPSAGSLFGLLPLDHGALLVHGVQGQVARSFDGGVSWQASRTAHRAGIMGATRMADGRIVLATLDGSLLVSRDDGAGFTPAKTATSKGYAAVRAFDGAQVLAVGVGGPALLTPGNGR